MLYGHMAKPKKQFEPGHDDGRGVGRLRRPAIALSYGRCLIDVQGLWGLSVWAFRADGA